MQDYRLVCESDTLAHLDRTPGSQHLSDCGVAETAMVLAEPPSLSRRVRLESRRSARKTNVADAISTTRAATGPGLRLIHQIDGMDEAPRLLSDRRPELVARRTSGSIGGMCCLPSYCQAPPRRLSPSVRRKVALHAQERAPVDLRGGIRRAADAVEPVQRCADHGAFR